MYDFKMNCTLVSCPIVFILSEVILNFQVKTLICTSQWKKKDSKMYNIWVSYPSRASAEVFVPKGVTVIAKCYMKTLAMNLQQPHECCTIVKNSSGFPLYPLNTNICQTVTCQHVLQKAAQTLIYVYPHQQL